MADDAPFEPRVAIASLSGESDAAWARDVEEYVGGAFLGGIAIDEQTRAGARKLVERDRSEFLPPYPISFIDDQLAAVTDVSVQPGFNVRTTTLPPLVRAATVCADHDAILEINAHCRQDEICAVGAGESLLASPEHLCEQVETAANQGATVSVKVRAEVAGVDLPTVAGQISDAGAEMIHVDAMDSEPVIAEIDSAVDMQIIANNGVRDRETVEEYLSFGADAVSVGRPSDNPAILSRVRDSTVEWFEEPKPAPVGEERQ